MSSEQSAFTFLPLGAIIQTFTVNGTNIVQGFDTAEQYQKHNGPYFGETIGRTANRIAGAKIDDLSGKSYELDLNLPPTSLHGGVNGLGKRTWEGPTTVQRDGKQATLFKYVSPDGEEKYPGTVEFRVWYIQEKEQVNGAQHEVLHIEYEAELVGDEISETAINLTNHTYFNLTTNPTIEGTSATLHYDAHLICDEYLIPQGPIEKHSDLTANTPITLGTTKPAFDTCFVVTNPTTDAATASQIDTRALPLNKLASFSHPASNIHLEVHSTEPAFQFYTGEHISVPAVDGLPARGARAGFCIEPSRFINAINVPEWRAQQLLKKGEKYGARIVYRGWQA